MPLLGAAACIAIVLTAGCAQKPVASATQQATVTLKDGTAFAGVVTRSSTAEITLAAPNGETRTYQMSQVNSVVYAQAPPANLAAAPAPAAIPPMDSTAPPAAAVSAPTPQPQYAATVPPEPQTVVRVIPVGTALVVRNNETIDSHAAAPGQRYGAVITRNVLDSQGHILIPHGSSGTLIVRSVSAQGKVEGQSELALDLESVAIRGRRYRLDTRDVVEKGHAGLGKNKRTAGFVGGGTVLGTLLGAVAGGGRGAAIGAVSGAAAGTATQTLTRGKGVRVPAETLLTFRLEAPVRVTEAR